MDISLCQEIEIRASELIWQSEYTHRVLFLLGMLPLLQKKGKEKRQEQQNLVA